MSLSAGHVACMTDDEFSAMEGGYIHGDAGGAAIDLILADMHPDLAPALADAYPVRLAEVEAYDDADDDEPPHDQSIFGATPAEDADERRPTPTVPPGEDEEQDAERWDGLS